MGTVSGFGNLLREAELSWNYANATQAVCLRPFWLACIMSRAVEKTAKAP